MFCKSVSECCYNQSHFNGFLCKEMECLYSIDKTQCRCFRRLDYSTQYNIHLVLQAFKIHWLVSMSRFMQVVLIVCGQQRISWTVLIIQIQIPVNVFTTDNPGTTVITHMITKVRSKRSPNYKENLLKKSSSDS